MADTLHKFDVYYTIDSNGHATSDYVSLSAEDEDHAEDKFFSSHDSSNTKITGIVLRGEVF